MLQVACSFTMQPNIFRSTSSEYSTNEFGLQSLRNDLQLLRSYSLILDFISLTKFLIPVEKRYDEVAPRT